MHAIGPPTNSHLPKTKTCARPFPHPKFCQSSPEYHCSEEENRSAENFVAPGWGEVFFWLGIIKSCFGLASYLVDIFTKKHAHLRRQTFSGKLEEVCITLIVSNQKWFVCVNQLTFVLSQGESLGPGRFREMRGEAGGRRRHKKTADSDIMKRGKSLCLRAILPCRVIGIGGGTKLLIFLLILLAELACCGEYNVRGRWSATKTNFPGIGFGRQLQQQLLLLL